MLSRETVKLCQATPTVSAECAKNPTEAPTEIAKRLYGSYESTNRNGLDTSQVDRPTASVEALDLAKECGKWGSTQPSELFLRVFHDALLCLDADPLGGMISPPLMGSHGTIPLTVIAPLADIFRHLANLIVRAEKEVIFITCAWSPSVASALIKDALKELSKRAGERGETVVVRIMYDKAGLANFKNPRQTVGPEVYSGSAIHLPKPEEIPHLDLQVINFHKPLLGTLHAKFMIVDRKIAAIQSNNTEDNDNVEMMSHLEGPIVDSIYDTALITWGNAFTPSLPSSTSPATNSGLSTAAVGGNGRVEKEDTSTDCNDARQQSEIVIDGQHSTRLPSLQPGSPNYDPFTASEITRIQASWSAQGQETTMQATNRQLNAACPKPFPPTSPDILPGTEFTPYILTSTPTSFPIALVSRPPFGSPRNTNGFVPQNEAWLSCIRNAQSSIFIQTPNLNAAPLTSAIQSALKRGVEAVYYVCIGYNDAGEIMPGQGGTNEMFARKLVASLDENERGRLHIGYYVAKDQNKPIHHNFKARSCHVKLLIADGHIGIQGSGNQDTQSWFHSQEINVLVDSREVCERWREGIERNQNTARFGMAARDGIWTDEGGREVEGSMGEPGAVLGWGKGVVGMVKKISEKGGMA